MLISPLIGALSPLKSRKHGNEVVKMSKGALLSILGLYQAEPTLFDNMILPEGLNKETVIDSIIQDCMELEVLYTSPYAMKLMISIWSRREQPTFERVYRAENAEYNPIENYDKHQTDQRSITRAGKDEATGNNAISTTEKIDGETTGTDSQITNGSTTGRETNTKNESISAEINQELEESGSKNETNMHKYAAFDSGNMNDQTQDVLTSSATNDQTTTGTSSTTTTGSGQTDTTGSTSETITKNSSGTSEENKTANTTGTSENTIKRTENTGETFTSYIHGNIGVTTSQQMLESELALSPKINTINYIVNSFKMRFCILVY